MMKNRIMILGALEEFVPLVRLAKSRGIRTVVADGNSGAPAKQEADEAYDLDIRDTEALSELMKKTQVDGVVTAYSDLLLECMVKASALAGLPCHIRPDQLPWYRDKYVTNRTLEKLGIGTPKSTVLKKDFADSELEGISFPMVIKPLDMYGSRGLRIVYSTEEIREAFDLCVSTSGNKTLLAEEYVDTHEFNIQCWVRHGTVHILGIADREKSFVSRHDIPVSTRNIYPSRLIREVRDGALDILQKYIGITGQSEGPLCMQFYWGRERGLEVGEIAARFLGYEHELLQFADDFSVEELLLDSVFDSDRLDAELAKGDAMGRRCAAVLYFHGRDGIAADLSRAIAIGNRNDVQYSRVFYHEGQRIGNPQTMPYVARYDIVADSRGEIDRISQEILDGISVRDPQGKELLIRNVLGTYE
ncbi:MAG: ATP-grasp domain-containing protein [Lachnospiraceae bacterium]|jgi:biotin carboxylase|nr:ATP-grasp domain-containing protein [Lachnospiraceae bacterium]MCI1726455.1 ATP-grasp domain-containing protein [Lachnospiraceae bacterium]